MHQHLHDPSDYRLKGTVLRLINELSTGQARWLNICACCAYIADSATKIQLQE